MRKRNIFFIYLVEVPNFLSIFLNPILLMSSSVLLLAISKDLNINITNLGFIFTFSILGSLLGELTSVLYNIKFRKISIIFISYILLILVIIALIFVTKLFLFYILYFLSGYILGVIWIQANEFLLESKIENKNRLINVSLIFFPVGAAIAPLFSIFILSLNLKWRYLYIIIIAIIILIMALYFLIKKRAGTNEAKPQKKQEFRNIFTNRNYNIIFIITVSILFLYGIAEAIIYTWSPSFFQINKIMNPVFSSFTLTIFWVGVGVGRIIISTILCRLKPYIMVIWLSFLSIISLFFMIFLSSGLMVLIAILFVGFGYSGIFSLIYSAGSLIYEKGKGVLETILFVITGLGAALTPYLTYSISRVSMTLSLSISLIMMCLIILLVLLNIYNYKKFVSNQNVC